jgi:pilus assembly protein CpaE
MKKNVRFILHPSPFILQRNVNMRVVLATESHAQRDPLRQLVLGAGLECAAGDCVSWADLPVRLAKGSLDLVLVAAETGLAAALPVLQHTSTHCPSPVLAVGHQADAEEILQALRSGAREYVERDHFREEFPAVLKRLGQAGVVQLRQGRSVAVIAANPGSGVTTVASNLAFSLAARYPRQVVLAELGNGIPELALDLDLKPAHTVDELLHDWPRMDAAMVRQTLVEHQAGVHVLAYPPEALEPMPVDDAAMKQALLLLRALYDFTVLDLGHSLHVGAKAALNLSEAVVLVLRLDIPSLRLARRFMNTLLDHGVPVEKLRIVANRYGQSRQLAWREAEKALGLPVLVWVPDDPASLNLALNHGQPLLQAARRAQITRRIGELANHVNGQAK